MCSIEKNVYTKNFLDTVILRIDFLEFISNEIIEDVELRKVIIMSFPRLGKTQLMKYNNVNIQFNPLAPADVPTTNQDIINGLQKEYFSADGNNSIAISNKFIVCQIKEYSGFDKLMQSIQLILREIYHKQINLTSVRTGIRYINLFRSGEIKLQKNLFVQEVAASLEIKPNVETEPIQSIRSMHTTEYKAADGVNLSFKYGMYNPDYPNVLKNNSFTLDFDCVFVEAISNPEVVIQHINKGHELIRYLFEQTITDALRKLMRNE